MFMKQPKSQMQSKQSKLETLQWTRNAGRRRRARRPPPAPEVARPPPGRRAPAATGQWLRFFFAKGFLWRR